MNHMADLTAEQNTVKKQREKKRLFSILNNDQIKIEMHHNLR